MFKILSAAIWIIILLEHTLWCHSIERKFYFDETGIGSQPCAFPGNRFYRYETTLYACANDCAATEQCTHFNYRADVNTGTCWFRTGPVPKDEMIYLNDFNARCGIKSNFNLPKRIPSPGYNVSTSQYWDCKAPSCSREGVVLRSKTYVKSCCKNDGDVRHSKNNRHRCTSFTDSFICDNYQPWAVNDQLAYGFASSKLLPFGRFGDCCACHKLTFLNESLEGKSMIIQIIDGNADYGVSISHIDGIAYSTLQLFNLLIPGGRSKGVDKCRMQWFGSVRDWSHVETGVSSREYCFDLPTSLQEGCLFRFDWLKNVIFPRVDYRQVRCPKELIDITGCFQGAINE